MYFKHDSVDWSRIFNFDVSKVTGYTWRCDSMDFTTKAGRAGQTSGPCLGRPGRFGLGLGPPG